MVDPSARRICASTELKERDLGVRFRYGRGSETGPAFVVRYAGQAQAFVNECAHLAVELDWQPGDFFDTAREALVCATHGARYHPASGACLGGRCNGKGLRRLPVEERDGWIFIAASAADWVEVETHD